MTRLELMRRIQLYAKGDIGYNDIKQAVEIYTNSMNKQVENSLNLAQAEIRSLYKRLNIKGSNVLDNIDSTLYLVQDFNTKITHNA